MDSRRLELQQDLTEVDKLLAKSTRDYVKQVLSQERVRISKELNLLPAPVPVAASEPSEQLWKQIEKFSWDQTDDSVKVYVTCLEDFASVPKENIKLEFTKDSVMVTVNGYKNTNLRLRFAKLGGEIKEGRVSAKTNGFVLSLKKNYNGKWGSLVYKGVGNVNEEVQVKGTEVDVSQNLMKLMQELYDEGDEEMKKLLSKGK